jgi:cytochrome c peroxidase
MFEHSSKFIKLSISLLLAVFVFAPAFGSPMGLAVEQILRQQIIDGGFRPAQSLYQNRDPALIPVGKTIFESTKLSLDGNISCRTCHQDKFDSADGVPNAAAVGGVGVGPDRLLSGAKLLSRRTLPLWGRGGKNFNAFFWDGRVSMQHGQIVSQFGSAPPSHDILVVADHLPVVEIREMLDDSNAFINENKQESVRNSQRVYKAIATNLVTGEPVAARRLAAYLRKRPDQLTYTDFARALAAFIRSSFRIRKTKLEAFAFDKAPLTEPELRGALVFYGNGRCIACHSGAYFSDFNYHTVAFPQLGFGKNGFGIDYGRYNATFNTRDLYRFRTPPLFNVSKQAYFDHSGSVDSLRDAIIAHYDPLSLVDLGRLTPLQRNDLYRRITFSQETASTVGFLSAEDIANLEAFLKTLSF